MRNVTDEPSNPFGMRPPCSHPCADGDRTAVFGFGDANADFHLIGDHPGVHGGRDTGVPFTGDGGTPALVDVFERVGLLERTNGEAFPLSATNAFLSYLYMCCLGHDEEPSSDQYADLERFFDAELRAINAHVLLPVGDRAFEHVLETHTARAHRFDADARALHATEVTGRGFLVVPIADPDTWGPGDDDDIRNTLESILARDYRQMVDLGRFEPTSDPYFVR